MQKTVCRAMRPRTAKEGLGGKESPASGLSAPLIPVAWGELIDKITILELKMEHLAGQSALHNVTRELALLAAAAAPALRAHSAVGTLMAELKAVNARLWQAEDAIRAKEACQQFDADFVVLARSIYKSNDLRAVLKKKISAALGSYLREEKFYTRY